jgi:hypothetical protein
MEPATRTRARLVAFGNTARNFVHGLFGNFFQGFDHKPVAGSVISRVASCSAVLWLINTIFSRFLSGSMIEIALN